MIYRCRWCERGYCEDCLDWDKTDLIGDSLKEFELLGFPSVTQAFFIRCPGCVDHHAANPAERELCESHAADYDSWYQIFLDEKQATEDAARKFPMAPASRAESLTDATTAQDSTISTPHLRAFDNNIRTSSSRKRKAALEPFMTTPPKRLYEISP